MSESKCGRIKAYSFLNMTYCMLLLHDLEFNHMGGKAMKNLCICIYSSNKERRALERMEALEESMRGVEKGIKNKIESRSIGVYCLGGHNTSL